MKPKWWDSIRAIIALMLVTTLCISVFFSSEHVNTEEIRVIKDLATLAVTFYFVLKKRKEES